MINEKEKMNLAIAARNMMLIHYRKGLRMFKDLFTEYGEDGMFHFMRADGYAHWKKLDKAKKDYQLAESMFYQEVWRQKARDGIAHCDMEMNNMR